VILSLGAWSLRLYAWGLRLALRGSRSLALEACGLGLVAFFLIQDPGLARLEARSLFICDNVLLIK